jgi:hypothetical protein
MSGALRAEGHHGSYDRDGLAVEVITSTYTGLRNLYLLEGAVASCEN